MVKRIAIYVLLGMVVLIVVSWFLGLLPARPERTDRRYRYETMSRCKQAMSEAAYYRDQHGRWPTNIAELDVFRRRYNSEGNLCDAWRRPLMLEVNEKDRKVTIWSYGYNGVNDGKTNNIMLSGGRYADDIVFVIEYGETKKDHHE